MEHRLDRYLDAHDRYYVAELHRTAADIDRDVCAQSECDNCGHRGLRYIYTGLARCPKCKLEVEF